MWCIFAFARIPFSFESPYTQGSVGSFIKISSSINISNVGISGGAYSIIGSQSLENVITKNIWTNSQQGNDDRWFITLYNNLTFPINNDDLEPYNVGFSDSIDNVLSAKVEVQNESVGQMIKNNVEQLKQSLLQNGVHLNSINISYHNSEQKQSGFQNQKKKTPSFKLNDDIETVDESVITKRMGYNTYEYLA